ncbi:hypothetical protein T265_06815 [Opisthorchis viverrini]|uniref:Uncharacterized protein n=1 Tax=Opisthorchis viverrini TaxID=6198 RepID=A0A075AD12_OPIVI|nr:hypothetical protein T265_06815 [Opisthorchis viverrini]KER25779.1 hypothetical protein T265_06815 [Opisthorchis viverrini]
MEIIFQDKAQYQESQENLISRGYLRVMDPLKLAVNSRKLETWIRVLATVAKFIENRQKMRKALSPAAIFKHIYKRRAKNCLEYLSTITDTSWIDVELTPHGYVGQKLWKTMQANEKPGDRCAHDQALQSSRCSIDLAIVTNKTALSPRAPSNRKAFFLC